MKITATMMAPPISVLCYALILAAVPVHVSSVGTADKTDIFPALRNKKHQRAAHLHHATDSKKLATDSKKAESVSQELDPEDVAVPDEPNVGPNGFPQLSGVTESLQSMSTEASTLEKQLVQAQLANQATVARKKASFEHKLMLQEEDNRAIVAQNDMIAKENDALQASNAATRKRAKQLHDGNRLMRAELKVIQQKLGVARDFLTSSMKSTDDSKATSLLVLNTPKSKTHHELATSKLEDDDDNDDADTDDEKDDDDSADDNDESFLALSSQHVTHAKASKLPANAAEDSDDNDEEVAPSQQELDDDDTMVTTTHPPANPGRMLDMLEQGVAALEKQEKDSEARLKQLFIAEHKAGAQRHAALMKKQQALNNTRTSLMKLQANLDRAESHLGETRDNLSQRLHGLGLFMQRMAHMALSPTSEASKLMDSLPGTISFTVKAAKKVQPLKDEVKDEALTFDN